MADFADRKTLSLNGARKAAQAAEAEAKKQSLTVSIAVLDEGGHLLHFSRMDGTGLASAAVAQAKARAAALFKRPTKFWEDAYASGKTHLGLLPGVLPVEGGLPILSGGAVVGAIGVSGASSVQDGQIAAAGVAVLGK